VSLVACNMHQTTEADHCVPPKGENKGVIAGETPQPSPVDTALAFALTEAAKAGRFDVVAQLAKELEARRLANSPNVVALDSVRGRP
jgi:hypothetical protein